MVFHNFLCKNSYKKVKDVVLAYGLFDLASALPQCLQNLTSLILAEFGIERAEGMVSTLQYCPRATVSGSKYYN